MAAMHEEQSQGRPVSPWLFAACVFLGAFLMFLVQPLMGKAILPRFGSSAGTWAVTLVFFQLGLLVGYIYAHLLSSRLSARRQMQLHIALLVLAALALPVLPRGGSAAIGGGNPTSEILLLLLLSAGLPYFLLASTSPLLQRWYANAGASYPYRLYAVSNVGSLLALLAYPVLLEPAMGIRNQAWLWSVLFLLFAALGIWITWRAFGIGDGQGERHAAEPPLTSGRHRLQWLLLAALPSALLVATTNRLNQDVPPIPFLFVVPLGLYLLSFIIVFDNPRWYRRRVFGSLLAINLAVLGWVLLGGRLPLVQKMGLMVSSMFFACVCLHGELARRRPLPSGLTEYYVYLAAGGALGGLSVTLLTPLLLDSNFDFEVTLVAGAALVLVIYLRSVWQGRIGQTGHRNWGRALTVAMPLFLALVVLQQFYLAGLKSGEQRLWGGRSFYGSLQVSAVGEPGSVESARAFYHGGVIHGRQFVHDSRQGDTTLYYGPRSGMGRAIVRHPRYGINDESFRIGAIGLGVGTVAAYLNSETRLGGGAPAANDRVVFYEIDQLVHEVAERHFSYLQDARDRGVDVVVELGDARQVMERQRAAGEYQGFDVLVVDAFSGGALPSHLLTSEALALFQSHLAEDGIIAYHISNRYLDLVPVLKGLAADTDLEFLYYTGGWDDHGHDFTSWGLLTRNRQFLADRRARRQRRDTSDAPALFWTDDDNAIYPLIYDDVFVPEKPPEPRR